MHRFHLIFPIIIIISETVSALFSFNNWIRAECNSNVYSTPLIIEVSPVKQLWIVKDILNLKFKFADVSFTEFGGGPTLSSQSSAWSFISDSVFNTAVWHLEWRQKSFRVDAIDFEWDVIDTDIKKLWKRLTDE